MDELQKHKVEHKKSDAKVHTKSISTKHKNRKSNLLKVRILVTLAERGW